MKKADIVNDHMRQVLWITKLRLVPDALGYKGGVSHPSMDLCLLMTEIQIRLYLVREYKSVSSQVENIKGITKDEC